MSARSLSICACRSLVEGKISDRVRASVNRSRLSQTRETMCLLLFVTDLPSAPTYNVHIVVVVVVVVVVLVVVIIVKLPYHQTVVISAMLATVHVSIKGYVKQQCLVSSVEDCQKGTFKNCPRKRVPNVRSKIMTTAITPAIAHHQIKITPTLFFSEVK